MAGFTLATALAISSGITAGTTIYGASKASSANNKALNVSREANAEALAFEREQADYDRKRQSRLDAIDEDRYASQEARLNRIEREDSTRWRSDANFTRERYNANAPFRATGKAALAQIAELAGLSVGDPSGEQVALVPEAAPPPPVQTPGRARVRDMVPGLEAPAPAPSGPPVGDDGLMEVTMSPEAYQQFSATLAPPRPSRRPASDLIPQEGFR